MSNLASVPADGIPPIRPDKIFPKA